MAVLGEASDLPQAQSALEQAHLLVGQEIGHGSSVTACAAGVETCASDAGTTALAVSQQVKFRGQYLLEEFGTVAAAIKDDRDASLAHQRADLIENVGQHLDQTGIGLCGDDKERVAGAVVDPVIGSSRQGDAHASHM